jgi:hypothetical protein
VRRAVPTLLFLVLLCHPAVGFAARLTVCAFGFHGPEEVQAFKTGLPSDDFEVVDLSPPSGPGEAGAAPAANRGAKPWLPQVCRENLHCDVTVVSGEFAGRFFGRSGQSLGLQEMEEASCQARCDGLFHAPREAFLLACNTLATKDEDMRSPAAYLQVLLDHGFDRADAERVVAFRYGPLGPTFREAFRRIFMGVPRLYGFSSVAPTGQYTGPMLDKYFRTVGNYRRHLERIPLDQTANRALQNAFAGTDLVETSGLTAGEPAVADRDLICTLYDEQRPVAVRLRLVQRIMERPDFLSFVPSIQTFVDRHPAESLHGEERAVFDQIRHNDVARDRILGLVHQLDVSSLKLELAHFAVHLGWLSRDEFRALAIESARELLHRPLTTETVDVMCEIPKHEAIGDRFTSDDLPDGLFLDPEGIRLVSCLAPPGDRVTRRLALGLDSADASAHPWAAYALTRRLPLPNDVLLVVAAHLNEPPAAAVHLEWIFRAQRPIPEPVRRAVALHDPRLAAELWPGQKR